MPQYYPDSSPNSDYACDRNTYAVLGRRGLSCFLLSPIVSNENPESTAQWLLKYPEGDLVGGLLQF